MSEEFKGDLFYIDPEGNRWRLTHRVAANNPGNAYWHADLINGTAHRASVSPRRLLMGIDKMQYRESDHDGGKESNDTATTDGAESNATDNSGAESSTTPNRIGECCSTESRRQASLY